MTGGSGFVAKLFHPPAFTTSTNYLLSGAIIGTSGSWSNLGNTKEKAFDGSLSTFFDAPTASAAWVGLDLGSGNQKILTTIRYYPRPNWSPRMVGGMFQGANAPDFSDAVTVYTIGYTPPEGSFTTVTIANSTVYRYLRYISPANGWCNVAEIQFYGAPMPSPPTGLAATTNSNQITLSWNASPNATGYNLRRAFNSGGPYMIIATNLANTTYTDTGLENGVTCYYVVSALAVGLESAFSAEINAAPGAPLPPLLTLTWNGTNLTLNWQGGGLLLEATNPSGPWTTNLGASSPLIVAPIQPQKFYRVRSQ
jgi:hypothetical protein